MPLPILSVPVSCGRQMWDAAVAEWLSNALQPKAGSGIVRPAMPRSCGSCFAHCVIASITQVWNAATA